MNANTNGQPINPTTGKPGGAAETHVPRPPKSIQESMMYRISPQIDWSFLCGRSLQQICIGPHQAQLHFDANVSLFIESDITIQSLADHSAESKSLPEKAALLVRFLRAEVTRVFVEDDRTLVVTFNEGVLRIHDANDAAESFQVTAPGIEIIV